jgi:IclR family acetate operon transcriptional repressor
VLAGLRDATGETANLIVRDGDELVYLDQVESPHALRHAGWVGRRLPLAEGAASAALAERDVGTEVRVARDAVELGVTAVACRLRAAQPSAALSVTAPTARMGSRRLAACRTAVADAAHQLDAALAAGSDDGGTTR